MKNIPFFLLILTLSACSSSTQSPKQPESHKNISKSWQSTWQRTDPGYEAELEIKSIKNDSIEFSLSASNGANTGELEGMAIVNEDIATYVENEAGDSCLIQFTLAGDSVIRINQKYGICGAGAGVVYSGEYKNEKLLSKNKKEEKENGLAELGVFQTKQQDSIFKLLTGNKYEVFVNSTQQTSEEDDRDSLHTKVYVSGVNGLYTIMENIIMIDAQNNIWAAVIDDKKVQYFTNTKQFTRTLPKTIENWRQRFKEYSIIYNNK